MRKADLNDFASKDIEKALQKVRVDAKKERNLDQELGRVDILLLLIRQTLESSGNLP